MISLNYSLRHRDFSDPYAQRVLQAANASFYFMHAGYRLRILLSEVFGAQQARYMEGGGFQLHARGPHDDGALLDDDSPSLFAMRPAWIALGAIHALSFLFHVPSPQIGFSAAEQRLLLNALLNRSDSELAHCLGLSVDAVKQTWRRIYERLAGCVPNLFPIDERLPSERRGAEKRRHVLDYMRLHLEEIRPWSPAKSMRDPR